jgi:hypothetical protein
MILRRLLRDTSAAGAAEFGIVLPLLLVFLFGIIDAGRFAWTCNQAEKATQVGARVAVVTDVIPGGLKTYNLVGQTVGGVTYGQGDPVQASALGLITCQSSAGTPDCACTTPPCPALGTIGAAHFTGTIFRRMQMMYPELKADNVVIEYRGASLGYAGDPSGGDVSPLVTVRLRDLFYTPMMGFFLVHVPMPSFSTTLTGEDGVGPQSN